MVGVRSGLKSGFAAGIVNVFVVLLGLPILVGGIVAGWISLPSQWPGAWILLLAVAWWGGARAIRGVDLSGWKNVPLVGLLAGLTHGLVLGILVGVLAFLTAGGADVRQVLAKVSPEAMDLLTFGLSPIVAALLVLGLVTLTGLLSTFLAYASARYRWEASMANVTPRFWHKRPISATGWIVPSTLEPWFTITRRVLLLMASSIASGETKPSLSNGT